LLTISDGGNTECYKSVMQTTGLWLLFQYKGRKLVILSKPFKSRKLAELARLKYPTRLAKRIGVGRILARPEKPSWETNAG